METREVSKADEEAFLRGLRGFALFSLMPLALYLPSVEFSLHLGCGSRGPVFGEFSVRNFAFWVLVAWGVVALWEWLHSARPQRSGSVKRKPAFQFHLSTFVIMVLFASAWIPLVLACTDPRATATLAYEGLLLAAAIGAYMEWAGSRARRG